MVNRKLNYKKLGIFCGVILIVILILAYIIYSFVSDIKLKQSVEYKLTEVGYTDNEIKVIVKSLDEKQVEKIVSSKYKKNLTKFLKEKYFIYDNLEKYLDYASEYKDLSATQVVAMVNTKANTEWYTDIKETDTSKGSTMLVNKFYGLKDDYVPEDLIEVSGTYGYAGWYVSESIYDDLVDMLDSARSKGYTMVVSQGYRSYEDQQKAYKSIQNSSGDSVADREAARPGHSEYQTGLSIDISPFYKIEGESSQSDEYKWLSENCYKYGFIVRYPEGKSGITGFSTDLWRLRYVGKKVSMQIYNEGITFDEYYAYYIDK